MAKTRSITRKQNHNDDASSRKRIMILDNDGVAPWSDVNHDVLFLVMMQLGVIDFLAFSGVCKSWRSLALSNMNTFMASRPPMLIDIHLRYNNQDSNCHLKDFEGRRFKTILPHSAGRLCIGVTCGYLILFGRETRDFWLVNPITRRELHFSDYPLYVGPNEKGISAILVFSPSVSGWVFLVLHRKISFYIEGKRGWNHVSSTHSILDLDVFKGKIYTLHTDCSLCELELNPKRKRKWKLVETKNFRKPALFYRHFISSGENLYITSSTDADSHILKLDFGENTIGNNAFFLSRKKSSAVIKLESWPGPSTQYKRFNYCLVTDHKIRHCMVYYRWMWYFPHDCLNVNLLDE